MPTQAPARIQLRWCVVRVLLAFIAFLLGLSSTFGGIMMMFESKRFHLEQLEGMLFFAIGIHMGGIGWISSIIWFADLAEKYSEYIQGSTRFEW